MNQDQGRRRWRPLSEREGRAAPRGPFEGVPAHLSVSIDEWIQETLDPPYGRDESEAHDIALALEVIGDRRYTRTQWLKNAARNDEDKALDILDAALLATDGRTSDRLDSILTLGGSVWKVDDRGEGLQRRVTATEQSLYEQTISLTDAASDQLQIAWAKVYGRQPDYSDAWDHAIKACEALLAPIVLPKAATPTLGSIISAIDQKPEKFSLTLNPLHGTLTAVQTFVAMLRLIWPNPDRHETGQSRPPTAEEARDVVHLAVTIVNWVRQGSFGLAP